MRKPFKYAGVVVVLLAGLAISARPACAQQNLTGQDDQSGASADAATPPPAPVIPPAYYGSITVPQSSGKLIKLPHPVSSLFSADPDIIEVRPASPTTMFVFGRKAGETTIVATDNDGNIIAQYQVLVNPSNYASDRLAGQTAAQAPGSSVSAAVEPGGIMVNGSVQSAEQAEAAMNEARLINPGGTVINNLTVQEPIQVELKVRIASMSRNVSRELGIDWGAVASTGFNIGKFNITGQTASAPSELSSDTPGEVGVTFPGGNFEGVIDALATDNLAHVLAEPTLTTLSGTEASFQVGGQFPIPVSDSSSSNGGITVTFKNYGVLLTFTPTVFSDGRIALQVAPQLSSISSANSAVISASGSTTSIAVPSLNITGASTTIILGSGQGMAIAGLLEDTTNQVDNGVPGLSEVPLLGALFRGDAFQREQQELVITVTPYIVNPVSNPGALASPDDGWTPPSDLQRILFLRDNGSDTASTTIPGDAGFMVQ